MSDENVYFIDKNTRLDDTSIITMQSEDVVWEDAYTEVVAYEEDVIESDQLDVTYTQDMNTSDNYDTAQEDNTQYYSMIDATVDESMLQDHDKTFVADVSENDASECTIPEHSTSNLTVIQYPEETIVPDQSHELSSNGKEPEEGEGDDQVILYKMEDSNELYAVQIARDADGQVQKYQYKVRQAADGQLEAVPGTIRIQPEGTEQLICDDSDANFQTTDSETCIQMSDSESPSEQKHEAFNSDGELNLLNDEQLQQHVNNANVKYEPDAHFDDSIQIEKLSDAPPPFSYFKELHTNNQQETCAEYFEGDDNIEEEFTHVEYLQDAFDDSIASNYESEKTKPEESIPEITQVRKYNEGSQIQVISDVVLPTDNTKRSKMTANIVSISNESSSNSTAPRQILNKISNIVFENDNIELKPIPNQTSNKNNKLTFLIVAQPSEQKIPPKHQPNKKYRSILRQTTNVLKSNAPVLKAYCKSTRPKNDISLLNKVHLPSSHTIKTESGVQLPIENKLPRPPRKQTITPVDRVGSEIIIQAPDENQQVMIETYDLDEISDDEYTPKSKLKKKNPGKKRGRKPKTIEIVISDSDGNSRSAVEELDENGEESGPEMKRIKLGNENLINKKSHGLLSTETDESVEKAEAIEKNAVKDEKEKVDDKIAPESETPPVKKRGPGRPRVIKLTVNECKTNSNEKTAGTDNVDLKRLENTNESSKVSEPKIEKNLVSNNSEFNINLNQETTVTRKRGRPKKSASNDSTPRTTPDKPQRKSTRIKTPQNWAEADDDLSDEFSTFIDTKISSPAEIVLPRKRGRPKLSDKIKSISKQVLDETENFFGFCSDNEDDKPEDEIECQTKKQLETKSMIEKSGVEKIIMKENSVSDVDQAIDKIFTEMEDMHGSAGNECPIIKESLKDDEAPTDETLLSILETSGPKETTDDVLKTALKNADILMPSDDEEDEMQLEENKTDLPKNLDAEATPCEPLKKETDSKKNSNSLKQRENKINTSLGRQYKCGKCTKAFSKYDALKAHVQIHTILKKNRLQCKMCPRVFSLESTLKMHEKIHQKLKTTKGHNPEENLTCSECQKSFLNGLLLQSHMQSHHSSFQCEKCPEKFDSRQKLLLHFRNHVKENLLKSAKIFSETGTRRLRRSTQTKTEFSQIIRIIEKTDKEKRKSDSPTKNKDEDQSSQNTHSCNICFKSFRQLAHLVMHRDVHAKPTCSNCGKIFTFKHILDDHVRRHCLKSPLLNSNTSLKRKSLANQSITIKKRQSLNKSTVLFTCDRCDKRFVSEIFFRNHQRTHKAMDNNNLNVSHNSISKFNASTKRQYLPSSQSSPKEVIRTRKTLSHFEFPKKKQETISRDNAFSIVKRKLERNSLLVGTKEPKTGNLDMTVGATISERRQSGRKQVPSKKVIPLSCDVCGLSFSTYTGLFRHSRTHSDIKKCVMCDATFKTAEQLSTHECEDKNRVLELPSSAQKLNTGSVIKNKRPTHGGIPLSMKVRRALAKQL